MNFVLTSLLYW